MQSIRVDEHARKYFVSEFDTSSETQGQQMGREKRRDEGFLSPRESAPGYQFSLDHCQTVKRMLNPEWAQKRLFIVIVSNRRTASPEFFSCVRTRPLLSRHTCQVRSPRL